MAGRPLQDGDFVAILNDFDASRLDYLVKFREKWKIGEEQMMALKSALEGALGISYSSDDD